MKSNLFIFTAILFFSLCFSQLKAQTVYITDSGKKFHAKNCSIAKTGKKGIELSEAKKQGFEPCKVCQTEEIKVDKPTETSKDKPKKFSK